MADFCQQCSIEHFGEDTGDLAGLINPPNDPETGDPLITSALCEGCTHDGCCYVNNLGQCLDFVPGSGWTKVRG